MKIVTKTGSIRNDNIAFRPDFGSHKGVASVLGCSIDRSGLCTRLFSNVSETSTQCKISVIFKTACFIDPRYYNLELRLLGLGWRISADFGGGSLGGKGLQNGTMP